MKKILICCLLCLLLLPIGMKSAGGDGETRCLLIGFDRFVTMPDTEPASANNVETMEALLRDFLPGQVTVNRYINGPGTVEGFEWLVKDTFREANDADTSLIYLSTHGLLREDTGVPRVVLLLSDGEREETLEPDRLKRILDRIPGEKILILDACHSGAMIGCGSEDAVNWFEDDSCRVLVSSGAREDSWFWSAAEDAYTGTGYFTSAMDCALRASDPEQIDPDESGKVSLEELTARLCDIHGASTVYCWPERSIEPLFQLPENRKPKNRLLGISFGDAEPDGETVVLPVHFHTEEQVRIMYQMVPSVNGEWDFSLAVRLGDRGKSGLIRGLVDPGAIGRNIRVSKESLGEDGRALMQIISLRGDKTAPVAEGGQVISIREEQLTDDNE